MGNDRQIFQICHRDSEITELSLDFLCALCVLCGKILLYVVYFHSFANSVSEL